MTVDQTQHELLFKLASYKLDGLYARELGHRVLTLRDQDGIAQAQALFTDVREGERAQVHLWTDERCGFSCFKLLRVGILYVFEQLQCARVHAITRESNKRAQRLIEAAGMEFESTLAGWYGKESGMMYRMLRSECRWLENKHG